MREGALILKEMREEGVNQLFTCGDGCWDVKGFIAPSQGAASKGEGVRILSAAPALGKVPGSAEFAATYTAKYGPINNYAASSYDSARVLIAAIEAAAKQKQGLPTRAEVVAALKAIRFQGIAYAKPVAWNEKGDNTRRGDLRQCRRRRSFQGDRSDRRIRSLRGAPQSARIFTFAALPIVSRLRKGRPKASASISNMSPFSGLIPSEKDSVAVPKKCTCTSPGRRNRSYLK